MYAVGKVGSLISRSVYTVSSPFHPFGGAVDIVIVQQQDGSFKSSPWYVRFGKFQGVLKSREKVVDITVNGVEAGFHMYLDSNGEAYFLRNADPNGEDGEFVVSPASSGDEREAPIQEAQLRKSKSTSCDSSTMEADVGDGKILARTTSRQSTILDRMFGRKSVKNNAAVDRVSSLERAEIAAELLDTKWSTNLSRGSKPHSSSDEPSKSNSTEGSSSKLMEASKTVLPEHSFDHGKEMDSNCDNADRNSCSPSGGKNSSADETHNCLQTTIVKEEIVEVHTHDSSEFDRNSCSPSGGKNSSADETDNCLQTTIVKEEIVEVHTHESSELADKATSTVHQPGPESLLNDSESDKSKHGSGNAQVDLLHNFEDAAGREMPTKDDLSDGIFEIHAVETDITSGKSEVVSQFVTVDSDRDNQNLTDANSPNYGVVDGSTERHEVSLIPTGQDAVQEKVVILSSSETLESSQDAVQEKVVILSSSETVESSQDAVEEKVVILSNSETLDSSYAVSSILDDKVHDASDISLSDNVQHVEHSGLSERSIQQLISEERSLVCYGAPSNEEVAINVVVEEHETLFLEDPAPQTLQDSGLHMDISVDTVARTDSSLDLVCQHDVTCPDASSRFVQTLSYVPDNDPEDVTKDLTVENKTFNASVTQTSTMVDKPTECIAQSANFRNKIEAEGSPTDMENTSFNRELDASVTQTSVMGDEPTECIAQSENFPNKIEVEGSPTATENKAFSGELGASVTQTSTMGYEPTECVAQSTNFPIKMEAEGSPTATGLSGLGKIEEEITKTEDDRNRSSSVTGDDVGFVPDKDVEAVVSFSEYTEEIQFQFSDADSFSDRKGMEDIVANKTVSEGQHEESDCDTEKQEGVGAINVANELENGSDSSRPVTNPVSIPTSDMLSGDNNIEAKSLLNLRSHIHDLERSDSFQLSRSLQSNAENDGADPVKSTDSACLEQKPEDTGASEESTGPAELTNDAVPDDKHADDLKVDSFLPFAELSLCRHLLSEGMGEDAASKAFDSEKVTLEKFRTMKQSLTRNNSEEQVFKSQGMIKVERVEPSAAPGGGWRIWPFSFRRTRTISAIQPVCENTVETSIYTPVKESVPVKESTPVKELDRERNKSRPKRMEKKVRSLTPTSEELASLDLKEGKNVVTFTFSTAIVGKQQVDCHIYLWKWNTRIVISDVDGTITKSDVLGQFMPLVGVDWSQNGVAHLFSAIKENGYQLLFLSARSISQAHLTRQFLFNLKQDGKALPDGPVVISPDGLFPSLYREVIRRAPHEFKISCLEDIKNCFPPDSNPFYAGFGNRDTDELSYLKVGIPMGKIFIINPKGEVAVNRRVDTKSYTSLHALVHGMFPPISSSSEQEDYNTWNYWKMPLPDVDM